MEGGIIKVGIFGHYGNRNLGDEAIIEACVQNIRRLRPGVQIELFSVNPVDTARRYGLPAHPVSRAVSSTAPMGSTDEAPVQSAANGSERRSTRAAAVRSPARARLLKVIRRLVAFPRQLPQEWRFLKDSLRTLRSIDLLIVAGSNQFLDNFGGPGRFPLNLFKWSILARLTGTRLAFVSVGAGPLDSPISRWLVRRAIARADYLSFRDAASRELVQRRPRGEVYPDLAFSLEVPENHRVPEDGHLVVGINPMPVYDSRYWYDKDSGRYGDYLARLARFCQMLLRDGHRVYFFGTQIKDENAIDDLLALCPGLDIPRRRSETVAQLMEVIAEADVVVPVRFHGTVLSLLDGRGVLGVCYYRKAADLLDDMHQEPFHVALDDFDPMDLYRRFRELAARLPQQQELIRRRKAEYASMLQQQYETVLSLAGA